MTRGEIYSDPLCAFTKTLSYSGRDRLNKIALLTSEGERDKELLWNLRGWHRFHRPPRLANRNFKRYFVTAPPETTPACRAKKSDNGNVRFCANFLLLRSRNEGEHEVRGRTPS